MEYSINNFLSDSECDNVIDYIEENGIQFSYTKDKKAWDCKRIPRDRFSEDLLEKFITRYSEGYLKFWFPLEQFDIKDFNLSLTKYYDGRFLNLHLDQHSQLTSVIVLSDNFSDGRFAISSSDKLTHGASKAVPLLGSVPDSSFKEAKKLHLEKGQCITFDGTKLYHGVMPVTSGIRYSLNIWMTNTELKFHSPSNKTLV